MRPCFAAAVTLSILVAAGGARAQNAAGDDAARAANTLTAVQLADQAGEAFQAGKFAEALDLYTRADALVHRHTIGLRMARCLVRLGRLLEASLRYEAVWRAPLPTDLDPDKLAKQKEAQAQAQAEREELLPRIPSVIVQLSGTPGAVVTLDGQPLPAAALGVKRAVDPGVHRIEARLGAEVVTREVTVKEREAPTVPIEIHADAQAGAPPPLLPLPPAADGARPRRLAGFALLGVGGAGILVGAFAGGMAVGKKNDLSQTSNCGPTLVCPTALGGEVDTYNRLRTISGAGFIAGGVVAAAGIVLVATAPAPRQGAPAALVVGPTGVSLKGAF